jgi:o-succinylbenzoate---CoA ligase
MTPTLPAALTLGMMSTTEQPRGANARALTVIDVPAGPASVDALWEPIDEALHGGPAIALVPQESPLTPLAMTESIRAGVDPARPVDSDTAVVLSTSGSTGQPRGVCLSATALTAFTSNINELAGGDPTWVLAIPPTSVGGLNVMIRARATGRRPIAVASVGGADRFTDVAFAAAVDAAAAQGQPVAVSLVPTQLPRLLETSLGRRALADCSLILVGGAALAPQAARDCASAGISITTTYGMTETSGGCILNGSPLPGVDVRLDQADGRIFLSGPMLASGYRDGANESFADGWLRTQDRGRWVDGDLQILGRLDDVVLINGVNVDLVAVEDRASDHPSITTTIAVAANDDDEARVHLIYTGDVVELTDIAAWIAQTLGSPATPTAIHRVESFDLTSSGKVDRRGTASRLGLELFADEL